MSDSRWRTRALSVNAGSNAADIDDEEMMLLLIEGTNPFGDQIYCYLELPYKNYKDLKPKMLHKERYNPRDFGRVVAAGLGIPSDDVKAEIKEEFGFVPISVNEPPPDKFDYEDVDEPF